MGKVVRMRSKRNNSKKSKSKAKATRKPTRKPKRRKSSRKSTKKRKSRKKRKSTKKKMKGGTSSGIVKDIEKKLLELKSIESLIKTYKDLPNFIPNLLNTIIEDPRSKIDILGDFGNSLGLNYQIYDDLIDTFGNSFTSGKTLGSKFYARFA